MPLATQEREWADAELVSELRWSWRSACLSARLASMIYTPSGLTHAIPTIGRVDLGPPIKLTVRLRPGQEIADIIIAAPLIASAMGIAEVQVAPLTSHWVQVILVPEPRQAR